MYDNFLCSQLLGCWYLDVDFLEKLIEDFDIDLDIECIKKEFWNININILIYQVYDEIKNNFLKENEEKIKTILWDSLENISDFEDYEIFTNCIDSHLWFNNYDIQDLFETRRSKYDR